MLAAYTGFRRTQPNIGTEILIPVTNLLERLFVEERRRLKIIPNAFGEKPVLKLMFGAMIRAAERWRAIKITTFERRQFWMPCAKSSTTITRPKTALKETAQLRALKPEFPAVLGLDPMQRGVRRAMA
jgi:hypothetical protein